METDHIRAALNTTGWMNPKELIWLADVAKASKVIIEVGCYLGRSTRCLADNTEGVVYAIDPWEQFYPDNDGNKHPIEPNVYDKFVENLKDHISSGKVKPIKEFFTFIRNLPRADFIFLDGDHREFTLIEDIQNAEKMLTNDGIIAGHDYGHRDWPGVKAAVYRHYGRPVELVESIWIVRYKDGKPV